MAVKRGEIYYISKSPEFMAVGGEIYSGRPGIIVSANAINAGANVVEVVYLSTQPKSDAPTHVTIRSAPRNSVALCEQINSVSVDRIGTYAGECTEREMKAVDAALAVSLGLDFGGAVTSADDEKIRLEAELAVYKRLVSELISGKKMQL